MYFSTFSKNLKILEQSNNQKSLISLNVVWSKKSKSFYVKPLNIEIEEDILDTSEYFGCNLKYIIRFLNQLF